ncbi:MAG: chemotaxis protein CheA [bacterium]
MDSFEQLKSDFLAETEDTLASLQRDLDDLAAGAKEPGGEAERVAEAVDRVFRTTHSLKGVSGMFGFDRMSQVAHAMENVLEDLREERLALDSGVCDRLYEGHELLWRLLGHATGADADPDDSTDIWLTRLDGERRARTPEAGAPLREALAAITVEELEELRVAGTGGRTIALLETSFDDAGYDRGRNDLVELVEKWGRVHATLTDAADPDATRFRLRILASSAEPLFGLLKRVGPLGVDVTTDEDGILAAAAAEIARPTPEASPDAPREQASPPVKDAAAGPESARPVRNAMLRVPVDRVDRLLGELGDLVQAKLALQSTAESLIRQAPDRMTRTHAKQSLRHLDRKLRSLQEGILGVRMVTFDSLFQKLERTTRETCRAVGREARLVTEGERVEIDKGVLDSLAEPLVHLLRNAIDHGLEDPATREAAGKPAIGTVRVSAEADGAWTRVEVADDGAGLDLDRIRDKALRRGLLAPDHMPSRTELLGIVFQPGFSVRDETTEISGRGVGLDAVRDAVESLGGRVEVDTGSAGTTFRLRLPVSLAVVHALEVRVREHRFFLPLNHVAEVARLDPHAFETIGGRELFVRGSRGIPVVDLGEAYGLGLVDRERSHLPSVTVNDGASTTVLLVDELGARREIVVRPLSGVLPPVPGIAGSTDLGDGRIVLVLDPSSRLRQREARLEATS